MQSDDPVRIKVRRVAIVVWYTYIFSHKTILGLFLRRLCYTIVNFKLSTYILRADVINLVGSIDVCENPVIVPIFSLIVSNFPAVTLLNKTAIVPRSFYQFSAFDTATIY